MKLILASNNKHKLRELDALVREHFGTDVEVVSIKDAGFTGEIIEDGESFAENALIKARAAAALGGIGVGDDSGLCVEALGGEPGIYSARYASTDGRDADDNTNIDKLLGKLAGIADRRAKFVCAIGCVMPDGDEFVVTGEAHGIIIDGRRGDIGFGYDPVFCYPPLGKTFAQLTESEKSSVSHRGVAMRAFAAELKKHIK